MSQIRVCGLRGLVVWCPPCKDWRPFVLKPGYGAVCHECCARLPEVKPYAKADSEKS